MSPCSFGILLHHHSSVPARVPGLVSLLFWHPFPSFPCSFGILLHHHFLLLARVPGLVSLPFWRPVPSWFRLGFRGLSPYSSGILFHHHVLVPARVPGLVSLLFLASCYIIISWFRLGFRGFFPAFLASCYIIIPWFRLGFRGFFPTLLASCSIIISWFWLGFRGLSPYSFGILFHHHFLVPGRVLGFVSLFFWHPVPSQCPGSVWFLKALWACLPSIVALSSIMISSFFLVPARVPWLVSLLLSFLTKRIVFHHDFLVHSCSGFGSGPCLPLLFRFFSQEYGHQ